MITKILVKKIKKGRFGEKDVFLKIDITPTEYYKLNSYQKTYFTKIIMGLNKINIKPYDNSKFHLEDEYDTQYMRMVGNEFVFSYEKLLDIWEKNFWKPKVKERQEYDEVLIKIIKNLQKEGKDYRAIFILEKV